MKLNFIKKNSFMKPKNFLSGFLTVGILMSGQAFGMDAAFNRDYGDAPRPGAVVSQAPLDGTDQVNISKALVRAGFAPMMTSPEQRLSLVSQYQKQVNGHQFFYVNVNGTTKITHDGANWVLVSQQPAQPFRGPSFTPPTPSHFSVVLPPSPPPPPPMAARSVAYEPHAAVPFAGAQMQSRPFLPSEFMGSMRSHQAPETLKDGIFQALLEAGLAAELGVGPMNPDCCASLFSPSTALPGQHVYPLLRNPQISVVYEDFSAAWELRGPSGYVLNNITGQREFKSHTQVTVTHSQGQPEFSILYSTLLPSHRNVTPKEAHIFSAFRKNGFARDSEFYGLTPHHSARGFLDFNPHFQSYQHRFDSSIHVFQELGGEWTLARILPNGQRIPASKIGPDFMNGGFLLTF